MKLQQRTKNAESWLFSTKKLRRSTPLPPLTVSWLFCNLNVDSFLINVRKIQEISPGQKSRSASFTQKNVRLTPAEWAKPASQPSDKSPKLLHQILADLLTIHNDTEGGFFFFFF